MATEESAPFFKPKPKKEKKNNMSDFYKKTAPSTGQSIVVSSANTTRRRIRGQKNKENADGGFEDNDIDFEDNKDLEEHKPDLSQKVGVDEQKKSAKVIQTLKTDKREQKSSPERKPRRPRECHSSMETSHENEDKGKISVFDYIEKEISNEETKKKNETQGRQLPPIAFQLKKVSKENFQQKSKLVRTTPSFIIDLSHIIMNQRNEQVKTIDTKDFSLRRFWTLNRPEEIFLKTTILSHVFSFLSPRDLGICASVCTQWRSVSTNHFSWIAYAVYSGIVPSLRLRSSEIVTETLTKINAKKEFAAVKKSSSDAKLLFEKKRSKELLDVKNNIQPMLSQLKDGNKANRKSKGVSGSVQLSVCVCKELIRSLYANIEKEPKMTKYLVSEDKLTYVNNIIQKDFEKASQVGTVWLYSFDYFGFVKSQKLNCFISKMCVFLSQRNDKKDIVLILPFSSNQSYYHVGTYITILSKNKYHWFRVSNGVLFCSEGDVLIQAKNILQCDVILSSLATNCFLSSDIQRLRFLSVPQKVFGVPLNTICSDDTVPLFLALAFDYIRQHGAHYEYIQFFLDPPILITSDERFTFPSETKMKELCYFIEHNKFNYEDFGLVAICFMIVKFFQMLPSNFIPEHISSILEESIDYEVEYETDKLKEVAKTCAPEFKKLIQNMAFYTLVKSFFSLLHFLLSGTSLKSTHKKRSNEKTINATSLVRADQLVLRVFPLLCKCSPLVIAFGVFEYVSVFE